MQSKKNEFWTPTPNLLMTHFQQHIHTNNMEYSFTIELTSQTSRAALSRCFGNILRGLIESCSVALLRPERGQKIEAVRGQTLDEVKVYDYFSASAQSSQALVEIQGALDCVKDEKLVEIESAKPEKVKRIFNRFRETVQRHMFPIVGKVTVSIGCTKINAQSAAPLTIDQADKALYFCKEQGRNRVAKYEDLVAGGVLSDKASSKTDITLF
jgi:hypothetical protein